ncbi:hypothetical protein H072_10983 [Dactylellina haptotyla CBS 200.50]|uniref:Uncharacterized protein n=1 Tax=Dactylellina haptotyla (strain CBS 200.50) TaxID=1284197 RepID=S8A368_DACHA|nr:hypothetical protein H072_10983 [Dactylellina haptotyla CBS 200.50]
MAERDAHWNNHPQPANNTYGRSVGGIEDLHPATGITGVYNEKRTGRKICGLPRKWFFIILSAVVILVIVALATGLGVALSRKSNSNQPSGSGSQDLSGTGGSSSSLSSSSSIPSSSSAIGSQSSPSNQQTSANSGSSSKVASEASKPTTPNVPNQTTNSPQSTTSTPETTSAAPANPNGLDAFQISTGRHSFTFTSASTVGNIQLCAYISANLEAAATVIFVTFAGDVKDSYTAFYNVGAVTGTQFTATGTPTQARTATAATSTAWYFPPPNYDYHFGGDVNSGLTGSGCGMVLESSFEITEGGDVAFSSLSTVKDQTCTVFVSPFSAGDFCQYYFYGTDTAPGAEYIVPWPINRDFLGMHTSNIDGSVELVAVGFSHIELGPEATKQLVKAVGAGSGLPPQAGEILIRDPKLVKLALEQNWGDLLSYVLKDPRLADQLRLQLHGWLRSRLPGSIYGPLAGIIARFDPGVIGLLGRASAAEGRAIAACATLPGKRQHIFFRGPAGGIRHIKYDPDVDRYIVGAESSGLVLADNAKSCTPLAALGYETPDTRNEVVRLFYLNNLNFIRSIIHDGKWWTTDTEFNRTLIKVHPDSKIAVTMNKSVLHLYYQTDDCGVREYIYNIAHGWVYRDLVSGGDGTELVDAASPGSSIAAMAFPDKDELNVFYLDNTHNIRRFIKRGNENWTAVGRVSVDPQCWFAAVPRRGASVLRVVTPGPVPKLKVTEFVWTQNMVPDSSRSLAMDDVPYSNIGLLSLLGFEEKNIKSFYQGDFSDLLFVEIYKGAKSGVAQIQITGELDEAGLQFLAFFLVVLLLANELEEESTLLNQFYQILFDDQLGLGSPLYSLINNTGRVVILGISRLQWDKLVGTLRDTAGAQEPQHGEALEFMDEDGSRMLSKNDEKLLESRYELTLLSLLSDLNRVVKDTLRQYLPRLELFCNLDILERFKKNPAAIRLGLDEDAMLRERNVRKRPDMFTPEAIARFNDDTDDYECQKCSRQTHAVENEGEEMEVVSGEIDESANDFLTFPGKMGGIPIQPLIDTGGGCNLVKAEWLRDNNISLNPNPTDFQTLLLADGSASKQCPCIKVKWSFDGRNKLWTNVEFVVVEGYKYDALIGLPFLKHTETIHNSQGRLVFPEFKGLPAPKGPIPLYNFDLSAQTGR